MPISKIKISSITADASSTNLNIDANTLYLDAANNNVGINNTSPAGKLDVTGGAGIGLYVSQTGTATNNTIAVKADDASTYAMLRLWTTQTTGNSYFLRFATDSNSQVGTLSYDRTNTAISLNASSNLVLNTNAVERLRVDSIGNIGIGITPNTWHANSKAVQISTTSANAGFVLEHYRGSDESTGNGVNIGTGWYRGTANTNFLYTNGFTKPVIQGFFDGAVTWSQAGAGAGPGNPISFVNTMTLNASGKLLLGTTSFTNSSVTGQIAEFAGTILAGEYSDATNGVTAIGTRYGFGTLSTFGTLYGGNGTAIGFAVKPMQGSGGWASSVSYPYARSAIQLGSGTMSFMLAGSTTTAVGTSLSMGEAVRIDSGGLSVYQGNGARPVNINSGSIFLKGEGGGWANSMSTFAGSGTLRGGFGFLGQADSLTYYWVGTAYNGTGVQLAYGGNSWTSLSDIRDKQIHGEIENALDKVDGIRAVYYNYNSDGEEFAQRRVGFIAQEVQAVLPEAVTEVQRELEEPTEETKRLVLAYSDVTPLLLAAIKEQQAIISQLTDRIAALEAK